MTDFEARPIADDKLTETDKIDSKHVTLVHDEVENEVEYEPGCCDIIWGFFPDPVASDFFNWETTWNEFMYDGDSDRVMNRNSARDMTDVIQKYADDKEYFDIYQVCAFDANNDRKAYKRSFIKAILCLFLQIPSLVFIVFAVILESDKTYCNLNTDSKSIFLKCLSFGYSLYVSFYIEDVFANGAWRGMYCIYLNALANKPTFLNGSWLRIGGYYNMIAGYCAIIGSFVIIFFAESAIDLVLNAVALFFIVEIDDLLVTKFDYFKIKKYCEDHKEEEFHYYENRTRCTIAVFETISHVFIRAIILVLRFIAPFYIGICS